MKLAKYKRLIAAKLAEHLAKVDPAATTEEMAEAIETVRIDLARAKTLFDLLTVIAAAYADPSLYIWHMLGPFFAAGELTKAEVNPTPGLTLTEGARWRFLAENFQ